MSEERVERRNVSIYPSQWAVIDAKAEAIGQLGNTSAGLKAVVAEYERLKTNAIGSLLRMAQPEQQRALLEALGIEDVEAFAADLLADASVPAQETRDDEEAAG